MRQAKLEGSVDTKPGKIVITLEGLPDNWQAVPLTIVGLNQVLLNWLRGAAPHLQGLRFSEMVDVASKDLEAKEIFRTETKPFGWQKGVK